MKPVIALLLSASLLLGSEETSRTWANLEGKTLVGTLKSKGETSVEVNLTTGKTVTLEIAKLSKPDQDYIAAVRMFHALEMTARTGKAQSNEKGDQLDARTIEVNLRHVEGRNLTITVKWLGPERSTVAVYKSETKSANADGLVTFDVVYRGSGVGSDYKGYAVSVECAGEVLARSASQKPFERFLD